MELIKTLFLFLLLNLDGPLQAQWVDVKEAVPDFYQAVANTKGVTPEICAEFFSYWTDKELKLLQSAISKLEKSLDENGTNINEHNYTKFTGPIFGVLGEIAISTGTRLKYLKQDDIQIMNAWDIDLTKERKKLTGNIPDGIVYRFHKNGVEILAVLESKMGKMLFSKKQARGYFNDWKTNGVHLYNRQGNIQHYPPRKIRFHKNQNEPLSLITEMSFDEFLEFSVTISSKKRVSHFGNQETLVFNTKISKKIANNFGKIFFRIKANQAKKRRKKLEKRRNRKDRNSTKTIEKKDLKKFLHQWFWSQRQSEEILWPKSEVEVGGISGKVLSQSMERVGNHAEIFIHFLSDNIKFLLLTKQGLPQIHLLEQSLIHANSTCRGLLRTFQVYFMIFEEYDAFPKTPSWKSVLENFRLLYPDHEDLICINQFK